jgi:hypothetical protein
MTEEQKTELVYLQELVLESTRWRISEDDDLSPIEREVRDRMDRLQEALTGNSAETIQEEDYRALEAARLNEHLEKADTGCQQESKVKLTYNGRLLRLPRYMLEQVHCKNSHTGYKWVVKDEYRAEADAKVEQLDGGTK